MDKIMIFAAGLGTRMGALTKNLPKPLIEVGGKSVLRRLLEQIATYDFKRAVINSHRFREKIEATVNKFREENTGPYYPEIILVNEPILLETGGGLKNASKFLGEEPIFAVNADNIIKADYDIFEYMAGEYRPEADFLLALQEKKDFFGYKGSGDFELTPEGRALRPEGVNSYKYVYSGLCLLDPKIAYNYPKEIFSLKELFFSSEKLYGTFLKNSKSYHLTSADDAESIDSMFKAE